MRLIDYLRPGLKLEERTPEEVERIKAERSCGDCSLCCKLMSVRELDKAAFKWCRHARPGAKPGACTIYEERPATCRTFLCHWRLGVLPEHMKPNKIGAVFAQPENVHDARSLNVFIDPGRGVHPEVEAAIKALSEEMPVIMLRGDRRTLFSKKRVAIRNPENDEVWISSDQPDVTYRDPVGRPERAA